MKTKKVKKKGEELPEMIELFFENNGASLLCLKHYSDGRIVCTKAKGKPASKPWPEYVKIQGNQIVRQIF